MEPRISILTLCTSDMQRAYRFYKDGLGFETTHSIDEGIYFFKLQGLVLGIYPYDQMGKEFPEGTIQPKENTQSFSGVTIAHNTKSREEVDQILTRAVNAGGKLIKPAQDVFWGGYSGYFADPDGHLWEIAYADFWQFNEDGSLILEAG